METNESLFMLIKKIENVGEASINNYLKDTGITFAQLGLMLYLEKHQGEKVTQNDLAEYLKIKHTSVIDLAKRLEEKDMIRRFQDKENRRYKNVVITPNGITVMKKFNNRKKESFESILDSNMTKEEQRILKELLQKVLCCLEKL